MAVYMVEPETREEKISREPNNLEMASLPPPRKKLRVQEDAGTPFPVPVASLTGLPAASSSWSYYTAYYRDGIIEVIDPQHALALWHNGYYGYDRIEASDLEDTRNTNRFYRKKCWKLLSVDDLQPRSFFTNPLESNAQKSLGNDSVAQFDNHKHYDESEDGRNCVSEESDARHAEEGEARTKDNISYTGNEREKSFKTILDLSGPSRESDAVSGEDSQALCGSMKLMPEEAMFLSYALGCLVVTQSAQQQPYQYSSYGNNTYSEMTIDEMWTAFTKADKAFPIKYAVYHHYRAKGWVVKSGLKFGADWVLYPVGPPFYHAQYTVMIQCVWSDTLHRDDSTSWREFSWTNIAATERLNSHVAKAPLICLVLRPRSLTDNQLWKPQCLHQLSMQELLLSRWLPNAQEQEEET
ncbi:tRNA-splicing endonuclease subunit SEN2-like isoform X2 [Penaeus japonicus]|uniref:tRNA-splicing endonuclease subunit SEN2-like isoform X2 n=1 Tax=Penaeus japonicus TaxID=27405 RepID=UPI001C70F8E6|nr:tRNA-splicing endonuclease subunit SEN2-like isoform X2 [Penaeus japonicus]